MTLQQAEGDRRRYPKWAVDPDLVRPEDVNRDEEQAFVNASPKEPWGGDQERGGTARQDWSRRFR